MMAVDDLKSLEETLAVLREVDTRQNLAMAETEVTAGETVGVDELHGLMGKRSRRS